MKIEKISENQIRFFLNEKDLEERNIKLSDLATGTEKTHALFRDMMEEALKEHGFYSESIPLIVEAIPVSLDSIMIIVTKVTDNDSEDKLNLLAESRETRKIKKKPIHFTADVSDNVKENLLVYSFDKLDRLIKACERISFAFNGQSSVHKLEKHYFLILENELASENKQFESILSEYGQKHISTELSKVYLYERADVILKENAVNKLSDI